MVDWPLRSVPEPPKDRRDLPEYLDALGVDLANLIARKLNKVVRASYRRFLDTLPTETEQPVVLTATGDYSEFDEIVIAWTNILNTDILPVVGQIYTGSSISAVIQALEKTNLPVEVAENAIGLQSNNAIEYAESRVPNLAGIGNSVAQDITDKVASSIAGNLTPAELRREIMTLTDLSEYRADAIARTEVGIAWNTADYETSLQLGEFGPAEKQWVATPDNRTRDTHIEVSGTMLKYDELFNVGGDQLRYPMDPFGSPAEVVNCRCVMLEFYRGDERPDGSIIGDDDVVEF